MNLVIDAGNTQVKFGIFEKENLIFKNSVDKNDIKKAIEGIHLSYSSVKNTIISSVAHLTKSQLEVIYEKSEVLLLNSDLKMPFDNLYATPKTLGADRLALTAAAVHQYPNQDVLVIDAGTCITYDFKNKKEQYLGGAIAPGIKMRYKSLHTFTANLPLLDIKEPKNYIGDSTNESIHAGVTTGILHEIDGVISNYCNTYPNLTVILTGGDTQFLSKRLKNSIFATSNFLLEGLNYILAFNNSR